MNHFYRIVFNRALGVMQAVSENSRAVGKGGARAGYDKRPAKAPVLKTALLAAALMAVCAIQSVSAQTIINDHQTVKGGADPGTIPSPWNVADDLDIGSGMGASLVISDGGVVNAGKKTSIGHSVGSQGLLEVNGPGSVLNNVNDNLIVGGQGQGVLNIRNGGYVHSHAARIGEQADSQGVALVDGDGSAWKVDGFLFVGLGGAGRVSISDGGVVDSQGTVLQGPDSWMLVSGAGSRLNTQSVQIGAAGNASTSTMTVENGAVVSASFVSLGENPDMKGVLNLTNNGGERGVLEAAYLMRRDGEASVLFDGGVLRPKAHEHLFFRDFEPGDIQIAGGGAYIDTNGFDIGIPAPLQGAGELIKQGEGRLTLSGVNTHQGGTRILGGVLSVASDANLGDAGGGLTLDGGALKITDSDFAVSSRAVTLGAGGGGFDMEFNSSDGEAATFSGAITGAGDLNKLGRGDLRLTGDNAYGNTIVREGELIGNSRSISGDVYIHDDDTASITFDQAVSGEFAGNINGAASPLAAAAKDGAGTLTLTGTSLVNWFVEQGELVTSAERFLGYAATGPDGTVTFHEAGDASLMSAVFGMGKVNKTGDGILRLLGDSSEFTGQTTVSSGTLSVGGANGAGRLGGTLTVANGGTLSGIGQVGRTTVESGGAVAPGHSVGTLTVAGDLTFNPGSRYEVEVNPSGVESDLIQVSGTATLQGGSVVHLGPDGEYSTKTSYRILSAGTGLTGEFGQVTSNLAFLTPSLAYDYANYSVDLTLQRNQTSFESLAETPNQRATASGLASLPNGSALYQRILNLPEGAPPAVFDSLSGEVHASVVSALQAGSTTVRNLPLSHLRRNLSAGLAPGALIAQSGTSTLPASSLPQSTAKPLWAEVVGNWRTMNSDGNAARLKQSTGGLFVGGDYGIGGGWRMGAALGYTDGDLRIDDRDSKADISTYSAALYGGKSFELGTGSLNLLLGGAYSRHDIKSRRHTAVGSLAETLKAHYHAYTGQVFGELGYALPVGKATIEPFAGLAWSDVRTRGFNESGGMTALSASSQSHDMTTSTMGLRAGTGFELGQSQGRIQGTVAWRHAFGTIAPERALAFDAGQSFTVAGVPIARDAALLELAADLAVSSSATVGASYGAQLGGGNREHVGKINVRWRF